LDDITISKIQEGATVTDYGMTKLYRAAFNDQSNVFDSNLFGTQQSLDSVQFNLQNDTATTSSTVGTSTTLKQGQSKETKQSQVQEPVQKMKPTFCDQQQLFHSKILSKDQIRQKIKNIFL
jgi:hypothetical protein